MSTGTSEASHLRGLIDQQRKAFADELARVEADRITYRNGLIAISSILEKACTEQYHQPTNLEIAIASLCHKLLNAKPTATNSEPVAKPINA